MNILYGVDHSNRLIMSIGKGTDMMDFKNIFKLKLDINVWIYRHLYHNQVVEHHNLWYYEKNDDYNLEDAVKNYMEKIKPRCINSSPVYPAYILQNNNWFMIGPETDFALRYWGSF